MNDDDLSELILRASAYLDGELDAAETARAEADPAVMAEVAALRELQDAVRDVEHAPDAVRESAISAALAEFDALNAAHVPVPPADDEPLHLHRPHAPVVAFRPRPAYTRWLTAAAAIVAVGVLGVVITGNLGGEADDSPSAALDATAAEASADARVAEAEGGFATAEATAEASAEESGAAGAAAEESLATEIAAADALEAPATTAAAEASAEAAFGTAAPTAAFPPFDADRPIGSIAELAAVGAELLAGEAAGTVAADVETACTLTPFEPIKRGLFDDGGGVREVIIAIDRAAGQTAAFDADNCLLVAVTPLP